MTAPESEFKLIKSRSDLLCLLLLAVIVVVTWCTVYHRWSAEAWQTPMSYRGDVAKSDIVFALAWMKAGQQGHYPPFLFKTVPELGAPHQANWNDYPVTEDLLIYAGGLASRFFGIFAGLNLTVLVAQVLAALSFFLAARLLNCASAWSFAGALIFAFTRYAFAHGAHHFLVTYYWHVPLIMVVSWWLLEPGGLSFRDPRFRFALGVAFVTGLQNVYYTNMLAQQALLSGAIQWARRGWNGWRALLPALALTAAAAFAFFLMNLDTFWYHFIYGPNPAAVDRPYKWVELGGLKIVDMLVPPPDHAFPPFAAWGVAHLHEIVLPPGEWPPTGYLGVLAIAALVWLAVVTFRNAAGLTGKPIPVESWQIAWILTYAGIGGLNCFVGALGFCLFRGTARYSIFVLAIALLYAVRRLSERQFKLAFVPYALALGAVLFAWCDQIPPWPTDENLRSINAEIDSDRQFVQAMEKRLPDGAMVVQLPLMEFPESPAMGVTPYDHFRPYLYSTHLRFSFGTDKGRPKDAWEKPPLSLQAIEAAGFAALYINKEGFQDRAAGIIKSLADGGRSEKIESPNGDLCCILLHPL